MENVTDLALNVTENSMKVLREQRQTRQILNGKTVKKRKKWQQHYALKMKKKKNIRFKKVSTAIRLCLKCAHILAVNACTHAYFCTILWVAFCLWTV